jgi:hypothetical protein
MISEWRVRTRRSEAKVGGWREVPGPLYEWCRRLRPGRGGDEGFKSAVFLRRWRDRKRVLRC